MALQKSVEEQVVSCSDQDAFAKNHALIEEDLHRTFPTLDVFRYGNTLYKPLKQVLLAFSVFRPDLGYVQGMSFLAGLLLMHMPEYAAFKCFANLMLQWDLMHEFYQFNMPFVEGAFTTFTELVRERMPAVQATLDAYSINCGLYLFEWIVTAFSNSFTLDVSSRIWDSLFFYGELFIFRVGLAVLKCLDSKIVGAQFEQAVIYVKNSSKYVSEAELMKAVNDISFKEDKVRASLDKLK